ncbi:hypothetical protein [Streptomyces griseofuscus]|uniref:hypothetical protein n=1 Tax=Streptomyces griseofuscus TaxID=146922 RepID=UPI003684CEE5
MDSDCQNCGAPHGYPYCNNDCRHAAQCTGDDTCPDCPQKEPAMFDKRKATTTPTTHSDQYRLKTTGQQVTLLEHLGNGEVRIAMDSHHTTRDGIVSAHDITPA